MLTQEKVQFPTFSFQLHIILITSHTHPLYCCDSWKSRVSRLFCCFILSVVDADSFGDHFAYIDSYITGITPFCLKSGSEESSETVKGKNTMVYLSLLNINARRKFVFERALHDCIGYCKKKGLSSWSASTHIQYIYIRYKRRKLPACMRCYVDVCHPSGECFHLRHGSVGLVQKTHARTFPPVVGETFEIHLHCTLTSNSTSSNLSPTDQQNFSKFLPILRTPSTLRELSSQFHSWYQFL